MRAAFGDAFESERSQVRQALERYGGQDEEGMTWILDALRSQIGV
jgi:hypothetical protein